MKTDDMVKKIYDILEEKMAEDILLLDISQLSSLADVFIITNGKNKNHLRSLCDEVQQALSEMGILPHSIEGYAEQNWILMDYLHVVVHIFDKENRAFYDLERIWSDAKPLVF